METEVVTGAQPSEIKALGRAGIGRLSLLWDWVERNGLSDVATKTRTPEERLAELLLLVDPGEAKDFSLWRRLGPITLLVVVLLGVIVAPFLLGAPHVVVRAAEGLPALHVVKKEDVEMRRGGRVAKSFHSPREVIGRVLLERVGAGVPLRESDLAPRARDGLLGRRVVSLPVEAAALGPVSPGSRIALLLSPRATATGVSRPAALLPDVLTLAVHRGVPSSLLVAVPEKELGTLGSYLSSSEVFPVQ
jgi:hypothetical protein